jgi:Peptide arylation enzymes
MQSELDRRFDEELARVVGPGGRLAIGRDEFGRAIVTNFPATLPEFFKAFCALNGANEAVVAGEERLTFADLDRISDRLAPGLWRAGSRKATGSGSRCATAPAGSSATWL